jgi:hypothetical protein
VLVAVRWHHRYTPAFDGHVVCEDGVGRGFRRTATGTVAVHGDGTPY